MQPKIEPRVKEVYNRYGFRITLYDDQISGTQRLLLHYKGKEQDFKRNLIRVVRDIPNYDSLTPLIEKASRTQGKSLTDYLRSTHDVVYVDDLGSQNGGVILGAYDSLNDKIYLRRDLNKILRKIEEVYKKQGIKVKPTERSVRVHEVLHRLKEFIGGSQNEQQTDLETRVISGDEALVRFRDVDEMANDPYVRERVLGQPGIDYIKKAA